MSLAIGDVLPFAGALAIGPFPNIIVMLLLTSNDGRAKSLAFFAGWAAGLLVTGCMVLVIVDPADPGEVTDPATWVSLLRLVIGLLLVGNAVKSWMKRPGKDDEPELPGWMGALDGYSRAKAATTGALLGSVNPKSLAFTLAGVQDWMVRNSAVLVGAVMFLLGFKLLGDDIAELFG